MADNVAITAGAGTSIASDDIGGVQYQRVKLALGAPNAYDTDVDSGQQTMASSVPVVVASDQSLLPAGLRPWITDNIYSVVCPAAPKGSSRNYLTVYNDDAALKVDILYVRVTQILTAAVTGLARGYGLFRFANAGGAGPSAGGEARTIRRLNTDGTAIDADITARTGVASTITLVGATEAEALAWAVLGEEETGSAGQNVLFDWREAGMPIVLNTDEGIVVQQDATAGTGTVAVTCFFRVR